MNVLGFPEAIAACEAFFSEIISVGSTCRVPWVGDYTRQKCQKRSTSAESRGLPHPSVSSSRFLVAKEDFRPERTSREQGGATR